MSCTCFVRIISRNWLSGGRSGGAYVNRRWTSSVFLILLLDNIPLKLVPGSNSPKLDRPIERRPSQNPRPEHGNAQWKDVTLNLETLLLFLPFVHLFHSLILHSNDASPRCSSCCIATARSCTPNRTARLILLVELSYVPVTIAQSVLLAGGWTLVAEYHVQYYSIARATTRSMTR